MDYIVSFQEIIRELIGLFEELGAVEQEKLQAVVQNNLKEIEACMKQEQVGIMRLKVLEKKREAIQAQMGLQGKSFRELIDTLEGDVRFELQEQYQKLETALMHFNEQAQSAKTAIEANLHSIEHTLEELKQKSQPKPAPGFTSKKV